MTAVGQGAVVRVVACAAPPVLHVRALLGGLERAGWQPHLVVTPTAATWLRAAGGDRPVGVSRMPMPGEDLALPEPDLLVVAPLTFTTVNRWASGLADTLAVGLLCEALGAGLATVAAPHVNASLAVHPAYRRNLAVLRDAGVRVVGDGTCEGGCDPAGHWRELLAAIPSR